MSGEKGSSIQMKRSHAEFGSEANEFENEANRRLVECKLDAS